MLWYAVFGFVIIELAEQILAVYLTGGFPMEHQKVSQWETTNMESNLDSAGVGSVKHSSPQEHIIAKAARGTTIVVAVVFQYTLSDSIFVDVFPRWIITAPGQ